ncbi:MAG: hypothetical protein ABI134_35560 [Byssovorax sp.]
MGIPTEGDINSGAPAIWSFLAGWTGSLWERVKSTGGALWTRDQPFIGARPVDLASDTTFTTPPRAVYVSGEGILMVDCYDLDGTTVLTAESVLVTGYQVLPFGCITKIYSTTNGTTATGVWVGA